jgi:hypothetical protein
VGDADAVEGEREARVRAALGAGFVVVLGRDAEHVAVGSRHADDLGVAADDLGRVVVAMIVRGLVRRRLAGVLDAVARVDRVGLRGVGAEPAVEHTSAWPSSARS